jgi:hypothetical protein
MPQQVSNIQRENAQTRVSNTPQPTYNATIASDQPGQSREPGSPTSNPVDLVSLHSEMADIKPQLSAE